jgi:hypothetical protein
MRPELTQLKRPVAAPGERPVFNAAWTFFIRPITTRLDASA